MFNNFETVEVTDKSGWSASSSTASDSVDKGIDGVIHGGYDFWHSGDIAYQGTPIDEYFQVIRK